MGQHAEKANRIKQAIAECDRYIEREAPRNPELRPAAVQQHLDFCIDHRAKLEAMLAEAEAQYDAEAGPALEAMQRGDITFSAWRSGHNARCARLSDARCAALNAGGAS